MSVAEFRVPPVVKTAAVRVAPGFVLSVWNDRPADAEPLIVSEVNRIAEDDADIVPDF